SLGPDDFGMSAAWMGTERHVLRGGECRRYVVNRSVTKDASVVQIERAELGPAEPRCIRQDGVEHRLQVTGGAGMTRSTSDAADCCSRASASSRLRAAFSFCRSLEAFGVFRAPEISCFPRRPLVMATKPATRPRAATCPRCEAMKPSAASSAVPRLSA